MIIAIALLICFIAAYEVAVFSLALYLGVEVVEGPLGWALYFITLILGNAIPAQIIYWLM
jgi:hypothetical protein